MTDQPPSVGDHHGVGQPGHRVRTEPIGPDDIERLRFRRQWLICGPGDAPATPSWQRLALGRQHVLQLHPDTRLLDVTSDRRRRIILGAPLYAGGLTALRAQLASPTPMTRLLDHVAGTYVAVEDTETGPMLYTDPAAMMGVYEGHGRVASTPALLGDLERDADLDRVYRFGGTDNWYPGELTPFLGVRALPANHRLHLASGVRERFWPLREPPSLAPEVGLERLAAVIKENVAAAHELGPIVCSLTGGRDTRVNLAALDGYSNVRFFTVGGRGVPTCDVAIPRMLATEFGLTHEVLEGGDPPDWLLELYDGMTLGLSIGGRRDQVAAINQLAGSKTLHLNGHLSGVGKGFYWHTRRPRQVRERTLMKEFSQKPDQLRRAVSAWHDSVPGGLRPTSVYNLMYMEQRVGRWASPGETASSLFYESASPHCSREVFDLVSGLPSTMQYGQQLTISLIRKLRPELLEVGFCRRRRSLTAYVPRAAKTRIKAVLP